ncbi:hypothetical protein [Flavobacterium psychrophilum]|uniref:hypothetical protein n=1 Tax=Flavobacterium psychrophilum TaxID=96345 RepID=UPI000B7C35DF|nr:hypothetical protein [Flavobacterium psychrophilum]ELY1978930.1 hypothetical protein [Flavobacterium psychrophilum]QRE61570.1 hypothetical protein H1R87_11390 [Flavobacterium psychrophilum]QRE63760.1 hypothetical protein H1R86_11400 [Flavobacterium psychrophilum]SNA87798.1 conserved membrane hypothetical protein [Flavobacterium psychrophilum]SNB34131.1 conserved membrane hypothetical protein [Flavobacterium psychrophilum]
MFKKNIKSIGLLALIIGVVYLVHKFVFYVCKFDQRAFIYSLEQLYLFFGLFSITIELILISVKQKNIDIVGNVFLLLTLVKMMVCFVFKSSVFKKGFEDNPVQKWNFLILFLLFLAIETTATIIILNKKETI